MSEQRRVRSLICIAEGYEYQITSDERYLYFDKQGGAGSGNEGTQLGTMRVVKAEVEEVRCMRVNGKTVIFIVFEGKTSRLVVKSNVKEAQLMQIFGGVPLKLSINAHSTTLNDTYELRLLSASFMVALLRMLCYIVPEIAFLAPIVEMGWIAIPFFWLVPCARRMLKGGLRDQFPMGGGMFASIFSGIMLCAMSLGDIEKWSQLILPAVVGAIAVGVIYVVLRRQFDWKAVAVVVLTSLLLFTPAASVCLNHTLPAVSVGITSAEILSLNEKVFLGENTYSMTVDVAGVPRIFHLSKEEYAAAQELENVTVLHKTGLLGISYSEVVFE